MPAVQKRERPEPALSKKKLGWIRLNQHYAEEFVKAGYPKLAQSLCDCETTELLIACSNCGHHFYTLNHCRQRVCVMCSFKVAKQRTEFLMKMTQGMKHPKLLTLTMPAWTSRPRNGIKYLRQCFTKLRRSTVWKNVIGGAYLIELKPHDSYAHIHLHVLMDCPYMPYQKIFSAWRKILGVSAPQVDIRSAQDPRARKYIAKDASKTIVFYVEPERIVDWYEATRGLRLFATFGTWFNSTLNKLLDAEGDPAPPVVCPNCGKEHTLFFARDGPYVLGPDIWMQSRAAYCGQLEDSRPRADLPPGWNDNIKAETNKPASMPDLVLLKQHLEK